MSWPFFYIQILISIAIALGVLILTILDILPLRVLLGLVPILILLAILRNSIDLRTKKSQLIAKNKPLVIAQVCPLKSGNLATIFNLIVQNTGTATAKNIKLEIDKTQLEDSFASNTLKEKVMDCFSDKGVIPLLLAGKSISNSFGVITTKPETSTWKSDPRLDIKIFYQDIDGNEYNHDILLKFDADDSFAGSRWAKTVDKEST